MVSAPVKTHPRLTQLARASFIATAASALISVILFLIQVDVYLLNHPPIQVGDVAAAALKTVAALGTGLGVLATVVGLVLRRISKRLAQAEQKREKVVGIAGNVADALQSAPQQVYRLQSGLGCAFPITVTVLGISVVVATITYVPSKQLAVALNNPVSGTTAQTPPVPTPSPTLAPPGKVTMFTLPANAGPSIIASGPDGNLWATAFSPNAIERVTAAGAVTTFPVPTGHAEPTGITAGPDGNLWFTEYRGNNIGRITPSGTITEFRVGPYVTPFPPPNGTLMLGPIAVGGDGNLWFPRYGFNSTNSTIDKITPAGAITEYPMAAGHGAAGLTRGPDGDVWFADADALGRITPSGAITDFPLPQANISPDFVTAGPDGNLWFSAIDDATGTHVVIGKSTPAGAMTLYPLGTRSTNASLEITAGRDGNLWVAEDTTIGRITPAGAITEYPLPQGVSEPWGITSGPDGNIWFTVLNTNLVGTITV